MYSCKGSCHPVQTAHTSAAELFHQSSRSEGLLHSGNLSLRQQMHQTATKKTTHSTNHQNIMGIFIMPVKCMKISTSRPYIQYVWILTRKAHTVNIPSICETFIMPSHKFTDQLNFTFIELKIPHFLLAQCSLFSPKFLTLQWSIYTVFLTVLGAR